MDVVAERLEGPAEWSRLGVFVPVPLGWSARASATGDLQLEHAKTGVVVRVSRRTAGPSDPQEGETVAFSDAGRFRRVLALEPTGTTTFRRPDGSLRIEWWTEHEDAIHVEILSQPARALQAITLAEEILRGLQML